MYQPLIHLSRRFNRFGVNIFDKETIVLIEMRQNEQKSDTDYEAKHMFLLL